MLTRMMNDFLPLVRLQNDMNRLWESFFEDMPAPRQYGQAYPGINIWEDGDNAWLECELPGLTLDDIEVLVMGNQLTINGHRKIEAQQNASYHRRERTQGQFSRTLTLPWEIDADHVEARLNDGVLSIRLPKSESAKPRKVKVQA